MCASERKLPSKINIKSKLNDLKKIIKYIIVQVVGANGLPIVEAVRENQNLGGYCMEKKHDRRLGSGERMQAWG